MMIFEDAHPFVLKEEGGYVNDPNDSGGATNFGVTQRVYDGYRKRNSLALRPVKHISKAEVAEIYLKQYWQDGKCDLLPSGVNLVHYDFCVNAGIGQAAKTLQRVVGVTADGKIGPQTLAAIASYDKIRLVTEYSEARRDFYRRLAERRPKDAKFLRGWLLRTNRCERRALDAIHARVTDTVAGQVSGPSNTL